MLHSVNVDTPDEHRSPVIGRLTSLTELDRAAIGNLSFFDPFLKHFMKEALMAGGEVHIAENGGNVTGIFLYDGVERTGSIFTRSREVFDAFFGMKSRFACFSELSTEHRREVFHVYTAALADCRYARRFNHEIQVAGNEDLPEIACVMKGIYRHLNTKWIDIAPGEGDRCFVARVSGRIAGVAWLSLEGGVGRLHSLAVSHQHRRLGIGTDLLSARLLWLRAVGARSVFSEIADSNTLSVRLATCAGMRPSVEMYQYARD